MARMIHSQYLTSAQAPRTMGRGALLNYAYVILPVPFTSVKRLASALAHEKPSHSKGA